MSLVLNSSTIDGKNSPTSYASAGFQSVWAFQIESNQVLTGKRLTVNPAFWIDPDFPKDKPTEAPIYGYSCVIPAVGNTADLTMLKGVAVQSQDNLFLQVTSTTDKILTIQIQFFNTLDLDYYVVDGKFINNAFRFLKNTFTNPRTQDISVDSVYTLQKSARAFCVISDPVSLAIDEYIYVDHLANNRWYEKDTAGGTGEFTGWDLTLERGGNPVTNLSSYLDTTIKVQVDTATPGGIGTAAQIVIFRLDDVQQTPGFFKDLEVGVNDGGANKLNSVDYINSYTPPALVAGTVYEIQWDVDHTKIQNGGVYGIAVIVRHPANDYTNSYLKTSIQADALPMATYGTMTGEIHDYNGIYTGNCLQVALWERIKARVEMDKASYDIAVGTNGITGTFADNFRQYECRIYPYVSSLPDLANVNSKGTFEELTVFDTATSYIAEITFRIPPQYANIPLGIDHKFIFDIILTNNTYTDEIIFRQLVNTDALEENEPIADQFVTDMVLFDALGNQVLEICEDFNAPLEVRVNKIASVDDYNLIGMIKEEVTATPNEQEDYTNNVLPQLNASPITAVDTLFVGNQASIFINPFALDRDKDYRVIATAKKVNLSPPVNCPIISLELEAKCISAGLVGSDMVAVFTNTYTVDNFAPATVTNVTINTTTDPKGFGANQTDVFAVATNNYNYTVTWVGGFISDPVELVLDVTITLSTGCIYQHTQRLTVFPLVGMKDESITDLTNV